MQEVEVGGRVNTSRRESIGEWRSGESLALLAAPAKASEGRLPEQTTVLCNSRRILYRI